MLQDVACGNGQYKILSIEDRVFDGVKYLHVVVEFPSERRVPRGMTQDRSIFLKLSPEDGWELIPVSKLDCIRGAGFDETPPTFTSEEEQATHIEKMILIVRGSAASL